MSRTSRSRVSGKVGEPATPRNASRTHAADKAPEPYTSVFGFVLVRKADLLAAVAFLLSLITLIHQFYGAVRGASIDLYLPSRVYLLFDATVDPPRIPLRAAADLTFANTGDPGRNGVVRDVNLTLTIGTNQGKQVVSQQEAIAISKISRDNQTLTVKKKEDFHPMQVLGGSTISQMLSFSPKRTCTTTNQNCFTNYIDGTTYKDQINNISSILLEFTSQIINQTTPRTKTCSVTITDDLKQELLDVGWYVPTCAVTDSQ